MLGSILRVLIAGLALLLACGATRAQDTPCGEPGGTSFRDEFWRVNGPAHPLLGKVLQGETLISIASGDCVRSPLQQLAGELRAALSAGGTVLLGEVHDNPEHHLVRADLLRSVTGGDRQTRPPEPGAVFEHLRPDQQGAVDWFYRQLFRSDQQFTAADLLAALRWTESGWPPAAIFLPLFDAVIDAHLPIRAGDPPRERIKALAREGKAALDETERKRLALGEAMDQPLLDALSQEIAQSHCGVVPASAFGSMSLAQRYRDALLAEVLVEAADVNGSAILLAGNGHVRSDRAVPWYVRRMAPGRRIVSVMLLEVEEGRADAASYLPRDPEGRSAADYVLFTPRTERVDPCQQMRERFSKKQ